MQIPLGSYCLRNFRSTQTHRVGKLRRDPQTPPPTFLYLEKKNHKIVEYCRSYIDLFWINIIHIIKLFIAQYILDVKPMNVNNYKMSTYRRYINTYMNMYENQHSRMFDCFIILLKNLQMSFSFSIPFTCNY